MTGAGTVPQRCQGPAACRRQAEAGSVTAETAAALPALVVVAVVLGWLIWLGGAQILCIDAARDAARAVARHDPVPAAAALARRTAPAGATVLVDNRGTTVEVEVRYVARPPWPVLSALPAISVGARSVVPVERRW